MKVPMEHCEFEPQVVRAVRSGLWSEGLRSHFASCPTCADAALIAESLREEAPVEVPAAGLVWWKSQLRRRLEAQERAVRPLVWAERAVIIGGVAAIGWTSAWLAASDPLLAAAVAGTVVLGGSAVSLVFWAAARR